MDWYQEITLIDQDEISPYFIWSKVYTQLHIAFAEHSNEQGRISFGVSFPQYRMNEQKKIGFCSARFLHNYLIFKTAHSSTAARWAWSRKSGRGTANVSAAATV